MRVADLLVDECVRQGVTHTFLVTGGGAMHLNDALFKNNSIKKFFFHHEQAAAIAAEGFARVTNKPVLLNVTTGPGGINAINGVYGAFVDSLPMIVISGQVKRATKMDSAGSQVRQLGDQEVDILSMVRKITKYACSIDSASDAEMIIQKAILISKSGRPGPVWIDVPIDVQSASVDSSANNLLLNIFDPNFYQDVNPSVMQEFHQTNVSLLRTKINILIEKFKESKRPILLVGNGIHIAGLEKELAILVENLGIPVVTGWGAHDLISEDNPYYVGRPGTVGDRSGNFAVQDADFLLVLGCRLNIRQISYSWNSFAKNAWKTMVDVDKNELEKTTLKIDNKIHTDLKEFIPEFLNKIQGLEKQHSHFDYLCSCKKRRGDYPVFLERMRNAKIINPYHFLNNLFNKLNKDVTIVCGNGSACVMTFQISRMKLGQRMFTNSGAASMGYDLPAAIGASIALENLKPVICIAGDGSVMMNLQELQTITSLKMNIKIIVINNNGYSSIKQTQRSYFPDRVCGVDDQTGLGFPDFSKISLAFGIDARKISTPDNIDSAIDWLLEGSTPKFLEIQVDELQDFEPKLKSRILPSGEMVSPELDDMYPFLSEEELLKARKYGINDI